ncbi:hypothetical protein EVAR_69028_1 [Eumeta japonica]|uniref:Uncharacterized protein n=1 Tax=Eumeta variegata TaxID=151549 RepID=A0A4C2A7F5_EUMVA|nr:hypothetical protein EVAR_69028_1 [Eumeta japonica]
MDVSYFPVVRVALKLMEPPADTPAGVGGLLRVAPTRMSPVPAFDSASGPNPVSSSVQRIHNSSAALSMTTNRDPNFASVLDSIPQEPISLHGKHTDKQVPALNFSNGPLLQHENFMNNRCLAPTQNAIDIRQHKIVSDPYLTFESEHFIRPAGAGAPTFINLSTSIPLLTGALVSPRRAPLYPHGAGRGAAAPSRAWIKIITSDNWRPARAAARRSSAMTRCITLISCIDIFQELIAFVLQYKILS